MGPAPLLKIAGALGLDGGRFGLGQCRQQQRGEDGDDGDHYQQFDEA